MNDLIIPEVVERIYREIAHPHHTPQPVHVDTTEKKIELNRADVDQIIQRARPAPPDELQYIIDHGADLKLTSGERNQLGVELSIVAAQRARQGNGRRVDASAEFVAKVLNLVETPWGLLARSFVDDLLRDGSRNISRCRA